MDYINTIWESLSNVPVQVWIIFFGVWILFKLQANQFFTKCPKCGKRAALKKTGETGYTDEEIKGHGFVAKIKRHFTERDEEREWRCKYCNHRLWKEIPKSNE